ncbi:class I SAM-dependent methyltransferase [Deltaproteobacteria bacterium OttesenSCG-928-K17]|nr:class I SAM-dependent methyltransferase [Deltaproteobacteria bacterium OttesenSCG-928-K17]
MKDPKFGVDFLELDSERVRALDKKISGLSMMSIEDRLFLNGLLRHFKPKHILELGVANGGTTVQILDSLSDNPEARVCSVDIMYHRLSKSPPVDIGYLVDQVFPELPEDRWQLHLGRCLEQFADELPHKFDFVILDTAHTPPGEMLDFLSILPYTADQCVFVVHDINLDVFHNLAGSPIYASGVDCSGRLLMAAVKAEKIRLRGAGEMFSDEISQFLLKSSKTRSVPNIGAFRTNDDTGQHENLEDIFNLLVTRWTRQFDYPNYRMILGHLRKHYPEYLVEIFELAYNYNRLLREKANGN